MNARRQRILMLLENNHFPQDSRVKKEADSLTEAGFRVTVIAPQGKRQAAREEVDGVLVYRYPSPHGGEGLFGYLWEYGYSMAAMFVLSLVVFVRHGFAVIHAHNPPDTLVFIGLFYKLLGKRFVFDHHDLSPELYIARFDRDGEEGRTLCRALTLFEKLSCRAADLIVATNGSYKQIEMERAGAPAERIVIVRNGPHPNFLISFPPDEDLSHEAETIIGYVGVIGHQDGLDYLLRALSHLVKDLGRTDFKAAIIGSGAEVPCLKKLAADLCIEQYVWFAGWQQGDDLLRLLATADICVSPDPSNPYNDRSTMIKLMEYMALGKPIVAFDLPEHRVSAGEAACYARPNEELDFARQIAHLMDHPEERAAMGQAGRERVRTELAWSYQAERLVAAYRGLTAG
jgi:glycosyltransferase involved in cell wall biosynthesis